MAVVAKGVSPPDLGLWLISFFASSETESAAQPGRALGFWYRVVRLIRSANLYAFQGQNGSTGSFDPCKSVLSVVRLCHPITRDHQINRFPISVISGKVLGFAQFSSASFTSISQKAFQHSQTASN